MTSNSAAPRISAVRILWLIILAAAAITCLVIRIRLLNLPLERDEGEYAYAGQLILRGIAPYQLAYNMKFPGTYLAYAATMAVFGQSAAGIHLGFLLVNFATAVLLGLAALSLFESWPAACAGAAAYLVFSINPGVLGLAAHATQLVVLPMIAGALLLTRKQHTTFRIIAAGFLFGLAGIMKQPGYCFVVFGAALLFRKGTPGRQLLAIFVFYSAGVLLPFVLMCLWLALSGSFEPFVFWTLNYARNYAAIVPLTTGLDLFENNGYRALDHLLLLYLFGLAGVVGSLLVRRLRRVGVLLIILLLCSLAGVSAGFYFRSHYFVLLLPLCALGCAALASVFEQTSSRGLQVALAVLFGVATAYPFLAEPHFFFAASAAEISRAEYAENPFPEAIRIADFIKERTAPGERLAVLGSEPEIYFYAQRASATGYIYMYPLVEPQPLAPQMQRQMIGEIERARPKFIVVVGVAMSWSWAMAGTPIESWAADYLAQYYEPVGLVNIYRDRTDYFLPLPSDYPPQGSSFVLIYQRRS